MKVQLTIRKVRADEQHIIGNLLQLYLYEFSDGVDSDVESDGRFAWDGLGDYWADESLFPYLVKADGALAGFALVQHVSIVSGDPNVWDMEDFFVLRKYRRKGVGSAVARQLFNDHFGPWEIRILQGNRRALEFWRQAIAVQCQTEVRPTSVPINGRPFDVFSFETSAG